MSVYRPDFRLLFEPGGFFFLPRPAHRVGRRRTVCSADVSSEVSLTSES